MISAPTPIPAKSWSRPTPWNRNQLLTGTQRKQIPSWTEPLPFSLSQTGKPNLWAQSLRSSQTFVLPSSHLIGHTNQPHVKNSTRAAFVQGSGLQPTGTSCSLPQRLCHCSLIPSSTERVVTCKFLCIALVGSSLKGRLEPLWMDMVGWPAILDYLCSS